MHHATIGLLLASLLLAADASGQDLPDEPGIAPLPTSRPAPPPTSQPAAPAAPAIRPAGPESWFASRGPDRVDGPLATEELSARVLRGEYEARTPVWRRGLRGWLPLGRVPAFAALLARRPPTPPARRPGQFGPVDAAVGRALLSRSDLHGGVYAEPHFYMLDDSETWGGRLVVGARVPLRRRVFLDLELALPWVKDDSDSQLTVGNLALGADVRLFGDDRLYGLLGARLHLPTSRPDNDTVEASLISFAADYYSPGLYVPETFTLRPDFKLQGRIGLVVLGVETGFDIMALLADDAEPTLAWHLGLRVGALVAYRTVYPFVELAVSRMLLASDHSLGDVTCFYLAPGINFQLGLLEAGLFLALPMSEPFSEIVDLSVGLRLGARW